MLVNCVAYQDGRKLADIAPDEIGQYVSRPECFVWVALKDPEPAELASMQREFGLHQLAVEDALHGHQRPKIEEYGASLFVALHTLEVVPQARRAASPSRLRPSGRPRPRAPGPGPRAPSRRVRSSASPGRA